MKFIKIGVHKKGFETSLPANFAELLEADFSWLEKQKKEGKLLEAYFLPGDFRNITIWEFDSPEAIDRHFFEDPLMSTFDYEIYPAADVFEHIKNVMNIMPKK